MVLRDGGMVRATTPPPAAVPACRLAPATNPPSLQLYSECQSHQMCELEEVSQELEGAQRKVGRV